MLSAARIFAILLLTLGFQIHGFVGALSAAQASPCATVAVAGTDGEPGQMVPDKPTPSCKVIGASGAAIADGSHAGLQTIRPTMREAGFASAFPQGPEKPPKAG